MASWSCVRHPGFGRLTTLVFGASGSVSRSGFGTRIGTTGSPRSAGRGEELAGPRQEQAPGPRPGRLRPRPSPAGKEPGQDHSGLDGREQDLTAAGFGEAA